MMYNIFVALICLVACVTAAVPAWLIGSESLYEPYSLSPPQHPDFSPYLNLGVKFSVDTAGNITGCTVHRYLCVNHQACSLYDPVTGDEIRRAFWPAAGSPGGGEVPRCQQGWMFTRFSEPFAAVPGKEYIISTLLYGGNYTAVNYGFNSSRTVGHITVPAQGGVWRGGAMPWMPVNVYLDSEYFISPMFKPAPIVQSLYEPFTYVPATVFDNRALSVGVRFSVDVPGVIVGCAAYFATGSCTDYHTCDLWSSTGVQLFDIAYPCNGGVAGWVFVNATTPIALTPNIEYTVSTLYQTVPYPGENNKFTSARTIGNIHVPADAGVFDYKYMPNWPQQTYLSSEYYVTPLFVAN